jgi:hypothetical protein
MIILMYFFFKKHIIITMQSFVGKDADIGQIDTGLLQVNQENTDLRWNPIKKHADIQLLNAAITAKLNATKSGEKAILAKKGYLIGTASESLTYVIHQGARVHVGLAELSRDLSTNADGDDLVSTVVTPGADNTVKFEITPTELTVTHNNKTTTLDLVPHAGKTMYPWLSDDKDDSGGFSVSINRVSRLSIYIDTNGTVVFETNADGGVDRPIKFDTGSAPLEFTGGQLITDTVHNVVESQSGTTLILRENGGVDVTIDAAGTLTTPGVVNALSMVTSSVESAALALNSTAGNTSVTTTGGNILLKAGGAGLQIADTTGVITCDTTLITPNTVTTNVLGTSGIALNIIEQSGGNGIHIADTTGNLTCDADVLVVGGLSCNSLTSDVGNLNIVENGGLGLHIADATGLITVDSTIVGPELRAPGSTDLKLHNWSSQGITVKDPSSLGAVECSNTVTVNSTLFGNSSLLLHNNSSDAQGITIAASTGDAAFSGSVAVPGNSVVTGTASVGPTLVDAGVCFAASDGTGSKAMLLPRSANHVGISPVQAGMIVFDTSSQKLMIHNGTVWQELAVV